MHSTNYTNVFIEIADDSKTDVGILPPEKQPATIARMQYDLIAANPYRYTSDELIFTIYAVRNAIPEAEQGDQRAAFFSKGQPCLRSSPLGKNYGWGIHYNNESRIAIYAAGSAEYAQYKNDPTLTHLKAMKSSR
jgi:Family of unknown function (DUF6157)